MGINHAFSRVVEFDHKVFQFTQNYCIKCHGSEEEKGDRTFHQLSKELSGKQMIDLGDEDKVNLLHDILDQLNLGEMPPKKKEVKQPKTEEIKQTIAWLTKTLVEWEKEKGPNQTVLRRLNRREYRNTMRDLLGLHDLPFDFTEDFPTDENDHGFTNVGDALNLSDQLIFERNEFPISLIAFNSSRGIPHLSVRKNNRWRDKNRNSLSFNFNPATGYRLGWLRTQSISQCKVFVARRVSLKPTWL